MHTISDSELGKPTLYPITYSPTELFAIDRASNRKSLGIKSQILPFYGHDLWYGYELSWLNAKGKPENYIVRITIPCESNFLIESKSLKLYFNSFSQEKFQNPMVVCKRITTDLSAKADTTVKVKLLTISEFQRQGIATPSGVCIDHQDITIDSYQYNPKLLIGEVHTGTHKQTSINKTREVLHSHLLRSTCPVTGQPDWGTLIISYEGESINHQNLLKYLCSYRSHQEFHEMCVERIFVDLMEYFTLIELTVGAQYLRRGGLDINPWRSTLSTLPSPIRLIRQ